MDITVDWAHLRANSVGPAAISLCLAANSAHLAGNFTDVIVGYLSNG